MAPAIVPVPAPVPPLAPARWQVTQASEWNSAAPDSAMVWPAVAPASQSS